MTTTTAGTSALMAAIETTWAKIRELHPDTPEVIVTMASGSAGRGGGLTLGHFAPDRWERGGDAVHELFVGGEGLARGALDVIGTLLHEAVHGIAATRQIQDTSRQGRYHNTRFRNLAAEVGIAVEHSDKLGWSTTSVPAVTAERYAAEVAQLTAAITAHRRSESAVMGAGSGGGAGGTRSSSNNGVALVCGCGRKIRASVTVAEAGPIMCGLCGEEFAPAVS
jgi:hypothetical protein